MKNCDCGNVEYDKVAPTNIAWSKLVVFKLANKIDRCRNEVPAKLDNIN